MNKRRLLKLAKLLETDAANPAGVKFDIGTWATRPDSEFFPKRVRKLDCKTTACAVGLACLSGAFRADGLRWSAMEDDNNIHPLFEGEEGYDAVQKFFGISNRDANFLFTFYSYPESLQQGAAGERAVAGRIRDFAAGRATAPRER